MFSGNTVANPTTNHQDTAVFHEGGCMSSTVGVSRRHDRPCIRNRVIYLCIGQPLLWEGIAADNQHSTIGEQGSCVIVTRCVERGDWGDDASRRVEDVHLR